ncbi:MAG: shikimate kinase [Elusimicrobia bacterium]|nr:shikimate kinase [Elusimicrobiota bacterium]
MKIALIGFTGVGKTEIGKILAAHLGLPFRDTDNILEERYGQSVTQLIGQHGVERFRDMETEMLAQLLETDESCVLATGGGTLVRPANRTRLKNKTKTVWLRATADTIWRHVQNKPYVAPLFMTRQDPLVAITVEMNRRRSYYEEAAEIAIGVDGKTPLEIAQEIAADVAAAKNDTP